MIEGISMDQINMMGLIVMVFVHRNELKNLGRRVEKLEDKA